MAQRPLTPEQKRAAKKLRTLYEGRKKELFLTQQKIADIMGVTQGAVFQWLSGKTPIGYKALVGFAKVLEVQPSDIFPELCIQLDGHLEEVMEKTQQYKVEAESKNSITAARRRLRAAINKLPEQDIRTLISVADGLAKARKSK